MAVFAKRCLFLALKNKKAKNQNSACNIVLIMLKTMCKPIFSTIAIFWQSLRLFRVFSNLAENCVFLRKMAAKCPKRYFFHKKNLGVKNCNLKFQFINLQHFKCFFYRFYDYLNFSPIYVFLLYFSGFPALSLIKIGKIFIFSNDHHFAKNQYFLFF